MGATGTEESEGKMVRLLNEEKMQEKLQEKREEKLQEKEEKEAELCEFLRVRSRKASKPSETSKAAVSVVTYAKT